MHGGPANESHHINSDTNWRVKVNYLRADRGDAVQSGTARRHSSSNFFHDLYISTYSSARFFFSRVIGVLLLSL